MRDFSLSLSFYHRNLKICFVWIVWKIGFSLWNHYVWLEENKQNRQAFKLHHFETETIDQTDDVTKAIAFQNTNGSSVGNSWLLFRRKKKLGAVSAIYGSRSICRWSADLILLEKLSLNRLQITNYTWTVNGLWFSDSNHLVSFDPRLISLNRQWMNRFESCDASIRH